MAHVSPASSSATFPKRTREDVALVQITFEDLSYYVSVKPQNNEDKRRSLIDRVKNVFSGSKKIEKCILKNMTGAFHPGRLTAIMGPSGSGKTSLLNLVAGYATSGKLEGNIWVNGRPADSASLRSLTSYVNQDDIILPTQTIVEAVGFSTALRTPSTNKRIQRQRCCEALKLLDLDYAQNTIIGDSENKGVSGGERKRVAIAMELVTDSSVLLLDEPTSGLDSHTAIVVIELLKKIALTGRTVVTVIHQPSVEIFNMFDDIHIVKDGRTVYMGERENCLDYFSRLGYICPKNRNPADFLLTDVLNRPRHEVNGDNIGFLLSEKRRVSQLADEWDTSAAARALQHRVDNPIVTDLHETCFKRQRGFWTQVKQLYIRDLKNMIRNSLLLRLRIFQIIFFALIGGMAFYNTDTRDAHVQVQNFQGASFYVILTEFFVTAITVLNTYSPQRSLFRREYLNGFYNIQSYFVSKFLIEIPLHIFGPIAYSAIMYWMVGYQRSVAKFFVFCAVAVAERVCGFSLGVHLACFFVDLPLAVAVIPLLVIPFMTFGGMMVNPGYLPGFIKWCQWISPIKYGYAALSINQFTGLTYQGTDIGAPILEDMGLGRFGIAANIGFILMFFAIFTAQAYFSLIHLVKNQGMKAKKNKKALKDSRKALLAPPDDRFLELYQQHKHQPLYQKQGLYKAGYSSEDQSPTPSADATLQTPKILELSLNESNTALGGGSQHREPPNIKYLSQ